MAALSPVSGRCVYGGVAEVSVYVDINYNNKGIGTRLLQELIKHSEMNGIWTLQSGIFPENKASIQLHKKLGFREIGIREKIGKKDDVWYDNVILEKRSKKIGID
ncbi:MAG: N-acetyltransferase family protein [Aureibaculum sp.]